MREEALADAVFVIDDLVFVHDLRALDATIRGAIRGNQLAMWE